MASFCASRRADRTFNDATTGLYRLFRKLMGPLLRVSLVAMLGQVPSPFASLDDTATTKWLLLLP